MNDEQFPIPDAMPKKLFYVLTALTVLGSIAFSSGLEILFSPSFAIAQITRPQDVWRQVYQILPDLPLENQYISKETGKPASENTLVSRLIRYHVYVKGRPPNYRLDWKMTIADYLDANDFMTESAYPGYDSLRQNPMESDRAIIGKMNRSQRDALVNALVTVFNPNPNPATPSQPTAPPRRTPPPTETPNPGTLTPLPQPGDSQQLRI